MPVSPKRAGKAVAGAAGGLGVVAAVARAAVSRGLPGGTWVAVVVLAAGITIVAGLALVLDYHRDRLEIAARAAESKARAELQLCRMEMYRDLVGKASGEPASSAGYRALILADALHMAVEEGKASPADRTHGSLYGLGSESGTSSGRLDVTPGPAPCTLWCTTGADATAGASARASLPCARGRTSGRSCRSWPGCG